MPNTRVLIVDDSVVVRQIVSKALAADPDLDVVGVAASGAIALAKIPQVNPDLIILDLDMPDMDGLTTLKHVQETHDHIPVIIFSALTQRGAIATLDALAQGAKDYLTKPSSETKAEAIQYIQTHLIPKVKTLGSRSRSHQRGSRDSPQPTVPLPGAPHPPRTPSLAIATSSAPLTLPKRGSPLRPISMKPPDQSVPLAPTSSNHLIQIIAIGVSTGGPNALATLLPSLPADLPVPVVVVQHMPPIFTERLAQRLDSQCPLRVVEGQAGMGLTPGMVAIAPGDFHMEVQREGTQSVLYTHQSPPENSCRPAVDVLFRSVVKTYGRGSMGIMLTGMGQDGFHGCQCIREAGGTIFAQDEATSVVWGMPGIVVNAQLADGVFPISKLGSEILKRLGENPW